MDRHSGWQILEQCLEQADGPAWTAFIERFGPALRWGIQRALRGLGFDGDRRDLAADLLQECYCKILARERRVLQMCRERDEKSLTAFFARLAERCTRDSLRARWAEKRGSRNGLIDLGGDLEDLIAAQAQPSPEDRTLMKEARSRLLETCRSAAGNRKTERNYEVLVMAFLEGLSSREISSRFAGRLSLTCIDSVVYRARRRLLKEGVTLGERRAVA
jgi:DNA-directed RNA polymerase specialized sigma24 family protein